MPDMVTKASTPVFFSTTSKDFNAIVRGPAGLQQTLRNNDQIPTENPGFFTVSVVDRLLGTLSATLTDKGTVARSLPPAATKTDRELVVLAYQVY